MLVLGAALLAGGALALPFASSASTSPTVAPALAATGTTGTTGTTTGSTGPTSTGTTGTGTTSTGTTGTTGTTATTTTTPSSTSTTPNPAAHPPRVGGETVERVSTTSAAIKAGVNPEGLPTTYRYQYGLTSSYGSTTGWATVGGGTAEVKLSRTISGLTPDTTYHFCLQAVSSAGAALGADTTFTTAKLPPSLTAAVTPGSVAFGHPLTVSGTASGPDSAGVEVVLQESPYPYNRGFQDITSPQQVDGAGHFSFPLTGLFESAQLRVATAAAPLAYSPPLGELVMARVTLHAHRARRRGYVRLYGSVTPSEPGVGVAFERLSGGRWALVGGTILKGPAGSHSHFARTLRLHRGRCRALVKLTGGALASGRSAPVTVG
ncbi:MAG TPA: hypothetical protein VNV37_02090 [Solirubrobacteraceae bacterium]|nr:hypothetical protein [Solirubrobacteraceae bacterium]